MLRLWGWCLIVFVDACLSMPLYKTKSPATYMSVDPCLFCARLIYASMSAAGLIVLFCKCCLSYRTCSAGFSGCSSARGWTQVICLVTLLCGG
jgi:hypothetical protein